MVSTLRNVFEMFSLAILFLYLLGVSKAANRPYLEGFCGPGQMYVPYRCEPCPDGTYQSEQHHQNINCPPCTTLEGALVESPYLIVDRRCTTTRDTIFKCRPGYYSSDYPEQHHSGLPSCWPCDDTPMNTRPEWTSQKSTTTPNDRHSSVGSKAVDGDKVGVNGSAPCNGSSTTQCNDVDTPCHRSSPGECGDSDDEGSTSDCGTICIVLIVVIPAIVIIIIARVYAVRRKRVTRSISLSNPSGVAILANREMKAVYKQKDVGQGVNSEEEGKDLIGHPKPIDEDK